MASGIDNLTMTSKGRQPAACQNTVVGLIVQPAQVRPERASLLSQNPDRTSKLLVPPLDLQR